MTAERFIADLVGTLVWPALIAAILVIFRKQFGTMLERLARLRLGAGGPEAGADWSQTEAVVRQSLAAARRPRLTSGEPGPPPGARPAGRARPGGSGAGPSPQALVEDRWQALGDELRDVIRPSGSLREDQLAGADFDQLMDAALRAGMLDAATVRSLDGLRHLRNLARTSTSLTQRQAEEFAVMAEAASYGLRRDIGSVWPAA